MMASYEVTDTGELSETFACFGSTCTILLSPDGEEASARLAIALSRRRLESWHRRFSRFLPDSELSRVNGDPRERVPVSRMMAAVARAAYTAGAMTGGLVDATLVDEIENAGYAGELGRGIALPVALELAPERRPARAAARPGWTRINVDMAARAIERPPGVKLDSGGVAKGLFADVLARTVADRGSFAINCAGDLSIGGSAGVTRPVHVESPFDGSILHTFDVTRAGVATSGIGRRSWLDRNGRPAHHLLDPSTGQPAFTGVVQVTALAPSALVAEIRAKAALLSRPEHAPGWLPDGGVIVFDDGGHMVFEPRSDSANPQPAPSELKRFQATIRT
jgi:thiamine biosynthesis lipoprotein